MQNLPTSRALPRAAALPAGSKGSRLKLGLRIHRTPDAVIVRCEGRIVYRQEASAMTRLVTQALQDVSCAVLDLSGVDTIDSAGLGALVLLHMYAEGHGKTIKLAAVPARVLELLELTNLTSVFEVHPTQETALSLAAAPPAIH